MIPPLSVSLSLFYSPPWSRFEIEIEPIFGSLALYDVKEKKKVLFSFFLLSYVAGALSGAGYRFSFS